MIKLNILPQELKKDMRLEEIYIAYKRFLSVSIFMLILFSAFFYASLFYLDLNLKDFEKNTVGLNADTEMYTKKVSEISAKLEQIESLQKDNVRWSDFLSDFAAQTGEGITIHSLSSSRSSGLLAVKGIADTRDSMLAFERNLKNLPYLSEINIPLKTLLEKEDINFDIQIKANLYDFVIK